MLNQFSRIQLVFGEEAMKKLSSSRVAIFGVGGVGGYTAEALVRSGIGALDLIDDDRICLTNINRQIFATRSTVGQYKVDVARARILDVNPDCQVRIYKTFYMPDTKDEFDFTQYDYIVDAIDTVKGKLELVQNAQEAGTPIISSMGAGNKVEPTLFEVADLFDTSVCPLARVMRYECRRRGIKRLKVVYSKEKPTAGGYVHQLQTPLYLSARHRQKVYPAQRYSRLGRLCTVCGRADHRRRGHQGSVQL